MTTKHPIHIEEQLREAEAMSVAVIDAALDAVVIADDEGIIRRFNRAAEAMFGFRAEDVIGKRISETIVPHVHRSAHENGMKRHKATGVSHVLGHRIEIEALKADGTIIPVELAIQRVLLSGGTIFAAYLRDLSAAKAAAREIEQQRERMHQTEKLSAMGSLLAGVAHELNNPLAVVVAQASLMEEFADDPGMRERAEKIHAAADRCARIVKSFLALARQKSPQREPVEIDALISGVCEMLSYGLKSAGILVEVNVAPGVLPVMAEKDMLAQVIANLVINSQQALAGRPSPRWIGISAVEQDGRLIIEVADNGPGIPADVTSRIYDPYFTTKPAGAGTGIGLAICRKIIEAHGGEIDHGDRSGGGTAFRISLPMGSSATAATAAGVASENSAMNVLIVDDDRDVAASLGDFLRAMGHSVDYVDSGEKALELLQESSRDAIFADLHMPGMNGLSLRSAIAVRFPGLAARTVIVTGDTVAGPAAITAAGGGQPSLWIEKPFTRADIAAVLAQLQK